MRSDSVAHCSRSAETLPTSRRAAKLASSLERLQHFAYHAARSVTRTDQSSTIHVTANRCCVRRHDQAFRRLNDCCHATLVLVRVAKLNLHSREKKTGMMKVMPDPRLNRPPHSRQGRLRSAG